MTRLLHLGIRAGLIVLACECYLSWYLFYGGLLECKVTPSYSVAAETPNPTDCTLGSPCHTLTFYGREIRGAGHNGYAVVNWSEGTIYPNWSHE